TKGYTVMNTGLRMSVAQLQNSLMERKTKDRQGMNSSLTVFLMHKSSCGCPPWRLEEEMSGKSKRAVRQRAALACLFREGMYIEARKRRP
ncbi:hypothetical protein, partial [Cohnella fermenti]|uniref:hypothetical protein n=1 Tax=Cohnella fermenti TaxID=2565925 RepID=UPI001B3B1EC4